jgi:hypothetical protein
LGISLVHHRKIRYEAQPWLATPIPYRISAVAFTSVAGRLAISRPLLQVFYGPIFPSTTELSYCLARDWHEFGVPARENLHRTTR